MNKELKEVFAFFGVFIAVVIIAFFIFSGDEDITGKIIYEGEDYGSVNNTYEEDNIQDDFSNIEELHWTRMPVTYSFKDKEAFYTLRMERVRKAIKEIERLTDKKITFKEVDEGGDISFESFKSSKIEYDDGTYGGDYGFLFDSDEGYYYTETLGEALPSIEGNRIINATVSFYSGIESNCLGYPSTEMHEILHVFGLDHSKNVGSVISERKHYCIKKIREEIDGKIFSCLKYIYSNGEFNGTCLDVNLFSKDDFNEYSCQEGWYEVEGSEYCCPEPDMVIIDGYCENP